MEQCKELQALSAISSEVDDSHVKVILASQCIKAQVFLVARLKKETLRQKGICKFISSGNLQLETEIKHAVLELKSMTGAYDALKSAKIELGKELLLAREDRAEVIERVDAGKNKYEELWRQCKKRYESIPYVQKYFDVNNKIQVYKDRVNALEVVKINVMQEIKAKEKFNKDLDIKRVVEMAKYLCEVRPKLIKTLNEEKALIKTLSSGISEKKKKLEVKVVKDVTPLINTERKNSMILVDGDWPSLHSDNFDDKGKDDLTMPSLQFSKNFLDNLADLNKLRTNLDEKNEKNNKPDESTKAEIKDRQNNELSENSFLTKPLLTYDRDDQKSGTSEAKYESRKLINIIQDMHINKDEAMTIVTSLNPSNSIMTSIISSNKASDVSAVIQDSDVVMGDLENEIVEEVNMSDGSTHILPPTPFSDNAKEPVHNDDGIQQNSQPGLYKKRVSFEMPVIVEVPEESNEESVEVNQAVDVEADPTETSQLDVSAVSNESFNVMKEMLLKRHHLDLSPDFVYAKNRRGDENITSKFFNKKDIEAELDEGLVQKDAPSNDAKETLEKAKEVLEHSQEVAEKGTNNNEYDEVIIATPSKDERPVAGFLFTHGPSGIPESLDVSINTTGFEEEDANYPHCIDSSLLLSPKGNFTLPEANEPEVASQDVPNFLSGLRKTGFSFFGGASSSNTNAESSENDNGNFSFNFGGSDGKKGRGAFFNMFQ